jgi:hypothetical protein
MSEKEKAGSEGDETYDLMLILERLESLREDLEETDLNTLADVEAALALIVPTNNPALQQKHVLLTEVRSEFLALGLTNRDNLQARIDQLNAQLDAQDED